MDALLNAASGGAAPVIKDSNTAGFRADVIEASMEVPVIVDFWATWCGPCKTLGPLLEKQVQAAGGKVRLVKVDIDQNQALAAQLRIQSVPTVYAFYQGRPVDGFMGAVPESQVKSFIDKLVQLAGHDSHDHVDELLAEAKTVLDSGNIEEAAGIYQHVLAHAPDSAAAAAGLARCLIALGEIEQAKQFLESLTPEMARHADIAAAKTALELAEQSAVAIAGLAGAAPAAGGRPERPRGAPGAVDRALRRRPARGGDGRVAGGVPPRPRVERAGGAQAAGQAVRGAGPDRPPDPVRPASVVLAAVFMTRSGT